MGHQLGVNSVDTNAEGTCMNDDLGDIFVQRRKVMIIVSPQD